MTVRERMALELAATRYAKAGAKSGDALWQLGMTEARFSQYVLALLERGDVEAEMPQVVRRLRRLRDGRREMRRSA